MLETELQRKRKENVVEITSQSSFTGVDVGTSRIVCCRPVGEGSQSLSSDLNAFLRIPRVPAVQNSLRQRQVPFLTIPDELLVCGKWSVTFAELFHAELRRPMKDGVINPDEDIALEVMSGIFERLLGPSRTQSDRLVFTVPSPSADAAEAPSYATLTNHESMLVSLFTRLGYKATALKEGEALVYCELADTNYTGIGISFGAGLCNVSMTYLAVPVLDFSIAIGGDFIDSSAAAVLSEKASRVQVMKEKSFSFSDSSTDLVSRTVRVFYNELIERVVDKLVQVLLHSRDIPRLSEAIPLVLAGGTALPQGFRDAFETALRKCNLPISEVRMAKDPLNAAARGALQYATINTPSE